MSLKHLEQHLANSRSSKLLSLLIHIIDLSKNKISKFKGFCKTHTTSQCQNWGREIPLQHINSNNGNVHFFSSHPPQVYKFLEGKDYILFILHVRIHRSTQFLLNKCLMNEYIKHCDRRYRGNYWRREESFPYKPKILLSVVYK